MKKHLQYVKKIVDSIGEKCEWCGTKCISLHKHHHHISKKNGGKLTVRICPNCHQNYHDVQISVFIVTASQEFIKLRDASIKRYVDAANKYGWRTE